MHIICTICTELITQEELESMYITRCGHIFHYQCMMQWINRSPCCPQCREKVTKELMLRVYPTLSEEPCHSSAFMETLLSKQQQLSAQIAEKDAKLAAMRIDLENSKKAVDKYKKELASTKAVINSNLENLQLQKILVLRLQRDNDEYKRLITSKDHKMDKKLADVRDKYKYQAKRNIEWRKAAKNRQLELYRCCSYEVHRKHRKENTSSSDSLSETDSTTTDTDSYTDSSSSS